MGNNIKIKREGDQILVALAGSLDEEVNFGGHSLTGANSLVFDFAEVTAINSCGIREWIRWLMPHAQQKMAFRNCPKVIVDQMNMVDGFLPGGAIVESFYVPYYSEESGEEKHVLFTLGKEYTEQDIKYPTQILDSKKKPMEIDVIESKYFRFLQKRARAA